MLRARLQLVLTVLCTFAAHCHGERAWPASHVAASRLLRVRGGAADDAADGGIAVKCTLRGKKYELTATLVSDIHDQIETQVGLAAAKQSVLFKGRVLPATAKLADEGVSDGDSLSIVRASERNRAPTLQNNSAARSAELKAYSRARDPAHNIRPPPPFPTCSTSAQVVSKKAKPTAPAAPAAAGAGSGLANLFGDAGAAGAATAAGGGGGGMPGMPGMPSLGADGMPDPAEIQKMMGEMLASPMMRELFEDPEKMEQTRQMMLSNPMIKPMLDQVPGMAEIIQDPEKWRQHMQESLAEIQKMQSSGALDGALGGALGGGPTQAEEEMVDEFDNDEEEDDDEGEL